MIPLHHVPLDSSGGANDNSALLIVRAFSQQSCWTAAGVTLYGRALGQTFSSSWACLGCDAVLVGSLLLRMASGTSDIRQCDLKVGMLVVFEGVCRRLGLL